MFYYNIFNIELLDLHYILYNLVVLLCIRYKNMIVKYKI